MAKAKSMLITLIVILGISVLAIVAIATGKDDSDSSSAETTTTASKVTTAPSKTDNMKTTTSSVETSSKPTNTTKTVTDETMIVTTTTPKVTTTKGTTTTPKVTTTKGTTTTPKVTTTKGTTTTPKVTTPTETTTTPKVTTTQETTTTPTVTSTTPTEDVKIIKGKKVILSGSENDEYTFDEDWYTESDRAVFYIPKGMTIKGDLVNKADIIMDALCEEIGLDFLLKPNIYTDSSEFLINLYFENSLSGINSDNSKINIMIVDVEQGYSAYSVTNFAALDSIDFNIETDMKKTKAYRELKNVIYFNNDIVVEEELPKEPTAKKVVLSGNEDDEYTFDEDWYTESDRAVFCVQSGLTVKGDLINKANIIMNALCEETGLDFAINSDVKASSLDELACEWYNGSYSGVNEDNHKVNILICRTFNQYALENCAVLKPSDFDFETDINQSIAYRELRHVIYMNYGKPTAKKVILSGNKNDEYTFDEDWYTESDRAIFYIQKGATVKGDMAINTEIVMGGLCEATNFDFVYKRNEASSIRSCFDGDFDIDTFIGLNTDNSKVNICVYNDVHQYAIDNLAVLNHDDFDVSGYAVNHELSHVIHLSNGVSLGFTLNEGYAEYMTEKVLKNSGLSIFPAMQYYTSFNFDASNIWLGESGFDYEFINEPQDYHYNYGFKFIKYITDVYGEEVFINILDEAGKRNFNGSLYIDNEEIRKELNDELKSIIKSQTSDDVFDNFPTWFKNNWANEIAEFEEYMNSIGEMIDIKKLDYINGGGNVYDKPIIEKIELSGNKNDEYVIENDGYAETDRAVFFIKKGTTIRGDMLINADTIMDALSQETGLDFTLNENVICMNINSFASMYNYDCYCGGINSDNQKVNIFVMTFENGETGYTTSNATVLDSTAFDFETNAAQTSAYRELRRVMYINNNLTEESEMSVDNNSAA